MKIKSSLLQTIILVLTFLCLNLPVKAQKKTFDAYLVETNLVYSPPKGYIDFAVVEHTYVPVKGYSSALWYFIKNQNKDILIGFTLGPTRKYLSYNGIDPNVSFTNTALHQADTTKAKIYHYSAKELTNFNAMRALKYDLDMDTVIFDKYDKCKTVALHRDNIGDGFIYYFYNDKSKGEINKEIKRTCNMLKFLPDNQFDPLIIKKD